MELHLNTPVHLHGKVLNQVREAFMVYGT